MSEQQLRAAGNVLTRYLAHRKDCALFRPAGDGCDCGLKAAVDAWFTLEQLARLEEPAEPGGPASAPETAEP